MAEVPIENRSTAQIIIDCWNETSIIDSIKRRYVASDDALFEETRDWCENYWCPAWEDTGRPTSWGGKTRATILAYIRKALDALIDLLLAAVYGLVDALISIIVGTVGMAAKLIDSVLKFSCVVAKILFGKPMGTSCCIDNFFEVLIDFLRSICRGLWSLFRSLIVMWYKLVGMVERMMYECDCARINNEKYSKEIQAAKERYGENKEYVIVFENGMDSNTVNVGTTGTQEKDEKIYITVNRSKPAVSKNFKLLVRHLVMAYNKWPYGADGWCWTETATWTVSFVTWKIYAGFLISFYLSTSNISSDGYTIDQHNQMMEYCKKCMPEELFQYIHGCVGKLPDVEKIGALA